MLDSGFRPAHSAWATSAATWARARGGRGSTSRADGQNAQHVKVRILGGAALQTVLPCVGLYAMFVTRLHVPARGTVLFNRTTSPSSAGTLMPWTSPARLGL